LLLVWVLVGAHGFAPFLHNRSFACGILFLGMFPSRPNFAVTFLALLLAAASSVVAQAPRSPSAEALPRGVVIPSAACAAAPEKQ